MYIFISFILLYTGKRACPGEPLAKNTFYLFVASLAKKFQFKAIDGEAPPTLEPHVGLTLSYKNFKTTVITRPWCCILQYIWVILSMKYKYTFLSNLFVPTVWHSLLEYFLDIPIRFLPHHPSTSSSSVETSIILSRRGYCITNNTIAY